MKALIAVAQTRRVLLAKQLIHETPLQMTEVALAAGFGSIRRFNEIFRYMYGKAPSLLRRSKNSELGHSATGEVTVLLRYRPPYDCTAQYIAMRELHEPDAFPAADVGLMRALTDAKGQRFTARELLKRAESWRPWRAYAAHHLWASLATLEATSHRVAGKHSRATVTHAVERASL